jgi:uncharacterized cupin superfamily protein
VSILDDQSFACLQTSPPASLATWISAMPITVIAQTAHIGGLKDEGVVAFPLTTPAVSTAGIDIEIDGMGQSRTGIWECQPGAFMRQLANAEVMHIVKGNGSFTVEGGETHTFRAGDTLFFPANTRGVWNVDTPLRKVYVILG